MTIEEAVRRATALDKVLHTQVGEFSLESPHEVVSSIRAYLIRRAGDFDSGARLSFGLTLQEDGKRSRLVSFRYQYNMPEGKSPSFLRFDLNHAAHENPLMEPLCHLHPGLDEVRLPFSVHHPLEILDRMFFVVDKNL